METPPDTLRHDFVELRRWRATDADLAFRLVSESLEQLKPWMPWASDAYSLADAAEYTAGCETSWTAGEAFQYLILADGNPAGSAGLMARIGAGGLEIGYWVHPAFTGRGVATAASAALTEAALALQAVDHVEIHHDANNRASERVPAKLGYSLTGTAEPRFELAPADSGTTKVWRITR